MHNPVDNSHTTQRSRASDRMRGFFDPAKQTGQLASYRQRQLGDADGGTHDDEDAEGRHYPEPLL
ncbi:hypothetical protein PSCLAVI8L_90091 [Pseudoclavibacter sp. 8L]|nr:hypothetical protein PSCLAVI8L_90091 [Pseudoclavibacter sp. 8L]